jgi:hypothetical protein
VENGGVNGDTVRNNSSAATAFGSIARWQYSKQVERHGRFQGIGAGSTPAQAKDVATWLKANKIV